MADECLLECYRLYRYEFEVFIGQLKATEQHSSLTCSMTNAEENDVQNSVNIFLI